MLCLLFVLDVMVDGYTSQLINGASFLFMFFWLPVRIEWEHGQMLCIYNRNTYYYRTHEATF